MHLNILGKDYGDNAPIFIDIVPDEFWKDDDSSPLNDLN
jgi:hypothetical protein